MYIKLIIYTNIYIQIKVGEDWLNALAPKNMNFMSLLLVTFDTSQEARDWLNNLA